MCLVATVASMTSANCARFTFEIEIFNFKIQLTQLFIVSGGGGGAPKFVDIPHGLAATVPF